MSTTTIDKDFDIETKLNEISLGNKIKLLGGLGWWHTQPIPENGIPSLRMTDGPNGARGTRFFNGVPSSCFPCSTGVGSSWDVDLAYRIGQALGDESRAKGAHVLLGPTVNTQRSPLGGRSFESFSEDPHLNGTLAASWINGLQSTGVAATIKHFVANDQEFERFSIDSVVSDRALREIYLKPFEIAIRDGKPWALMTAYNRLNGLHCSEHDWLLKDLLRGEWAFEGMVMSDWIGVYSTAESIKAGLDIEMPGPTVMRGPAVNRALIAQKLMPADIDERVRKILGLLKRAAASGIPFDAEEKGLDTPEVRTLLREAAGQATVLLKNDRGLLPIKGDNLKGKKIAVLGPNARVAQFSGGGSARLLPTYAVSPLEGITAAAKEVGAEVIFNAGANTHKYVPHAHEYIAFEGKPTTAHMQFWNAAPTEDWLSTSAKVRDDKLPKTAWETTTAISECFLADGVPPEVEEQCWIRYSGVFTPSMDGPWEFGLNVAGRANLYLDGTCIIDLSTDPKPGEAFFNLGTEDKTTVVKDMQKEREYAIEVRIANGDFVARGSPFKCWGGLRLGAAPYVEAQKGIEEAAEIAKSADVTILVIGLNQDFESEGFDRPDMKLPGATNQLVTAILAAQPNTIIVNQSGAPVEMPWIKDASTLLQAFYGGNELGNGLADVLFGRVNPSGKLALTFPVRGEDAPAYPSFGAIPQEHGKIVYNEGVFVGYRSYEVRNLEPLFPFGHGLSYTTFEYSDLSTTNISDNDKAEFTVSITITNTGSVPGREVALVFVSDAECSLPRPVRELKGFAKTKMLGPGEKQRVEVKLGREALAFWDSRRRTSTGGNGSWVAEKGEFGITVAGLETKVVLEKELAWRGL